MADINQDNKSIVYAHGFVLGDAYGSYKDAMNDILASDKDTKTSEFLETLDATNPPSHMDTSIGGNEVINPYPGGDPDDDIIFPLNSLDGNKCKRGLGHVYKECIQDTQKVLWLTFGTPKFQGLSQFMGLVGGDKGTSYAKAINDGHDGSEGFFKHAAGNVGKFLGGVGKLAISIPFLPIQGYNWLTDITENDTITKYYDFQPATIQYYKIWNSLIGSLAVAMGLYMTKDIEKATGKSVNGYPQDSLPEILKNGPDIFTILDKRRRLTNPSSNKRTIDNTEALLGTTFDWQSAFIDVSQGADQFIGWRVEKGTDTSESISNTTGESEISAMLNGFSEKARSSIFSLGGMSQKISTAIDSVAETVNTFIKTLIDSDQAFTDKATTIMTGNGYFDIPEVWKNSSFTKSYTFSIELESRLGDPISIFQNLYVPLMGLLAAATPRCVGDNMYTSPFILQAYCQGMFAIPLGIIDSITIKRGSADYGWTYAGLPTTINVSFNIKDLSPVMFLALAEEGFMNIFKRNSSMHEYVSTLAGLGVADRKRFGKRILRKFQSAMLLHRSTTFSPHYWAMNWGSKKGVRTIGMCFNNKWPN